MKYFLLRAIFCFSLADIFVVFAKNVGAASCVPEVAVTLGTCSDMGSWDYDAVNKTYRYCNGTNYISMRTTGTLSSCAGTIEGTLEFDTGINNFKFCDGVNWIAFKNVGNRGVCSAAGKIDYNAGIDEMEFCNGGALSAAIETTGDNGSLSIPGTATWDWNEFAEYGPVDAGSYSETEVYTVTNTGTCDIDIISMTATPVNDCATGAFPFCGGGAQGYAIRDASTCSGTLLVGDSCTVEIIGQIILLQGGTSSVNGVLTINTSTLTETKALRIIGCDEVGSIRAGCS